MDPFDFTVTDNLGLSSPVASVSIQVTPVNDAPTATSGIVVGSEDDASIPVALRGVDTEDGSGVTVTITSLPPATKGVLYMPDGTTPVVAGTALTAADASQLVFVPASNYNTATDGPVDIPFTVTDSGVDSTVSGAPLTSTPGSFKIDILPVNDTPVALSLIHI